MNNARLTPRQESNFFRSFGWLSAAVCFVGIEFLGWPVWLVGAVPLFGTLLVVAAFDSWNDLDWFPSTRLGHHLARRHERHASRLTHAARRPL